MKKILFLAALLLLFSVLFSNPIYPEVKVAEYGNDGTGWKVRLYPSNIETTIDLSTAQLHSNSSSAYFNNGLTLSNGESLIITQDDMQTTLDINLEGDDISFSCETCDGGNLWFGNVGNLVAAPSTTQSVRSITVYTQPSPDGSRIFCLDNTPFSSEGEPDSYIGNFQGYIYNEDMEPLLTAEIVYWPTEYGLGNITPNSTGWFERPLYATNYTFQVKINDVVVADSIVSIYPESINRYDFILEGYSNSDENDISQPLYCISNSPNPFNPVTTISFGRVLEQPAKVKIYNSKGGLVDELNCASGKESISWNAGKTASGVYFYKLEVDGSEVGKGKMLLLK